MITRTLNIFFKKEYVERLLEEVGFPTLSALFYAFVGCLSVDKICCKVKKYCLDASIHDILLIYVAKELNTPLRNIEDFLIIPDAKILEENKTTFRIINQEIVEENFDKVKDLIWDNLNYFYEEKELDGKILDRINKKFKHRVKQIEFLLNTGIVFYQYLLNQKK
jgi:hypothetical protein